MQVSVSRIPDPRSTQAGSPRTGGRRLQSSWLRRLGGPRRRKRRLRRLHGGAASTLLFNITLVTFSSVSRFRGELQALSTKAESPIFMYFLLFLFHPFPESLGGQSLNFTQPCFLISHLSPSVSGFLGTFHQMAPSSIFYVFLLLISIASLDTRVITMSFSLCSNLPQNVVE